MLSLNSRLDWAESYHLLFLEFVLSGNQRVSTFAIQIYTIIHPIEMRFAILTVPLLLIFGVLTFFGDRATALKAHSFRRGRRLGTLILYQHILTVVQHLQYLLRMQIVTPIWLRCWRGNQLSLMGFSLRPLNSLTLWSHRHHVTELPRLSYWLPVSPSTALEMNEEVILQGL